MTKAIIAYIRLNGWFAERIGVTGQYRDNSKIVQNVVGTRRIGSKQWIPGTGTKGRADISAKIAGKSVEIEVKNKYTGDTMRPAQKEYAAIVKATGGIYFIARSFEEFADWFDASFERNAEYMEVWAIIKESKNLAI